LADAVFDAPVLANWPIFAASSLFSIALLYGLGNIVRALGESMEVELWRNWDGPPSTRYLRHRDRTFGSALKTSLRYAIEQQFGIHLLSADEELKNRGDADRAIADAFVRVRQYLRKRDSDGLWSKHNAEYGFSRNLLACRVLWVVVSLCACIFAGFFAAKTGASVLNPAVAIGIISLICAVYVGWFLLPNATKKIAEGYAESAWMAFLDNREPSESKATTTGVSDGVRN
jgi:hypothetical protein